MQNRTPGPKQDGLLATLNLRDNIDEKKTPNTTHTRKSSTSSNNTTPMKANAASQRSNGEWLPDSRKSAHPHYSATPTLAANLNTPSKQGRTSGLPPSGPGSSSSSSTGSTRSNNNVAPPRPPKDGLQYANLDQRSFMQDPRNRVLPGSGNAPPPNNTTYATVTTREVTQTSSRTFGGNNRI